MKRYPVPWTLAIQRGVYWTMPEHYHPWQGHGTYERRTLLFWPHRCPNDGDHLSDGFEVYTGAGSETQLEKGEAWNESVERNP